MCSVHCGIVFIVFGLSHLAYLLVLPGTTGIDAASGAGLVLYVVILTQCNDVAQFIWGKTFGKHKVVPKVSPNKTWEGLIGGVITTIVIAMIVAPILTPLTLLSTLFTVSLLCFSDSI